MATDLFGLGTASLRWIPVREDLTIDVPALERRIEEDHREGHQPFLLVGTAGTVSTGAVDPLARLAAIARKHVNFRTTLAHLEALPAIVVRHGDQADRSLRPAQLRAGAQLRT